MVRPPYWVAARIYSVAAGDIARARISGSYTLHTGKDVEDLPPKLYLDVVEAWLWEKFTTQDKADQWLRDLHAPPVDIFGDIPDMVLRAALTAGAEIEKRFGIETTPIPVAEQPVPAGWDNDSLLAEALGLGVTIE